ncbi:MAG: YbfB/YjiJ family MFS transporter [Desulfuromonadales bacterium]|nr:YbfB/YjiJ family MFS transporter [Desulfuromonadales bacterium]
MPVITSRTLPFHYGWVIIATGALVIFSCFGLARYAYTMLLPGMQAGLGLAYERMGLIGTGNFAGYLTAVLATPPLIRRLRPRLMVSGGLLLIALCMIAISQCHSYAGILSFYTLAGVGGGFANIPMMALVTFWFRSEQRGRAAGLVLCGNGAGIIFSGALIPLLNRWYGADGWRSGWLVLGVISLVIAVIAGVLLRNSPAEIGLEPVGRPPADVSSQLIPRERRGDGGLLVRLGLLYLVFGSTFMVYGTFIVTTMVKEYGFSEAKAGLYWSWTGIFSLFSGVGFGSLSDRIGRKHGMALVFTVQTLAYLLAGLHPGAFGLMLSVILYGLAVFALPAIMTAAVGDYLGLSRAATALATITIFFAAGQTIGPGGAGLLAGVCGGFAPAYLLSALLTAGAALLAIKLPPPPADG